MERNKTRTANRTKRDINTIRTKYTPLLPLLKPRRYRNIITGPISIVDGNVCVNLDGQANNGTFTNIVSSNIGDEIGNYAQNYPTLLFIGPNEDINTHNTPPSGFTISKYLPDVLPDENHALFRINISGNYKPLPGESYFAFDIILTSKNITRKYSAKITINGYPTSDKTITASINESGNEQVILENISIHRIIDLTPVVNYQANKYEKLIFNSYSKDLNTSGQEIQPQSSQLIITNYNNQCRGACKPIYFINDINLIIF